ncbi:Pop1 [Sergentomyia squamirostris]
MSELDVYSSQYDASIGGHVELPDGENTFKYAEKRLPDLAALINTVRTPTKSKLIFQSIPRHMRRRTASQNPKRLPINSRLGHLSQLRKSGTPTEKKRPARKYRRRMSNLRKEYARRQMKVKWLETHIWHAKRFHMIHKWGFKIPHAPCDKSYRACYRATSKHCLLQDVSYLSCLEIQGKLEDLSSDLKRCCNPTELSFVAKCYLSGEREGVTNVFQIDKYPHGAIGQVNFLWKPPDNGKRCLWIFFHPSIHWEFFNQLISLFSLERTTELGMEVENQEDKGLNLWRNQSGTVQVRDFSQKINRFRLTGPLSQAVLSRALRVKENPQLNSKDFNQEAFENQKILWEQIGDLSSPGELPQNMILGLVAEDPRLNRPQKRVKALPDVGENSRNVMILKIPKGIAVSPIWDHDWRNSLQEKIMNTQKYCQKREKECLVPGERCSFEDNLQPLPVLLIQRPGVQTKYKPLGYSSGWDIILPAGYGMIMWMSLIMWGARAGGWRETISNNREVGKDVFMPDTSVCQQEDTAVAQALREKYFRKPAKKRPNYIKLSIQSPFRCPWQQLIEDWSQFSSFYVLRNKGTLHQLSMMLKYQKPMESLPPEEMALIPVYVRMISRGNPGNFALLTLPTEEELQKSCSGESGFLHVEPLAKDPNQKARKDLRKSHTRFLKQQRRLRIRMKKKLQEETMERVKMPRAQSQKVVVSCEKFKEQMDKLWLPQNCTVKDQCSRPVIGYVTQSDFTFTDAAVTAIGYVTWNGLKELLRICQKYRKVTILVRGTKTRNYRGGSVSVRQP